MVRKKTLNGDGLVLMDEVTMNLTGITPLSVGDSVRNYFWPVVKTSEPVPKLGSGLVSFAHTVMGFLKCLLCLFIRKAV